MKVEIEVPEPTILQNCNEECPFYNESYDDDYGRGMYNCLNPNVIAKNEDYPVIGAGCPHFVEVKEVDSISLTWKGEEVTISVGQLIFPARPNGDILMVRSILSNGIIKATYRCSKRNKEIELKFIITDCLIDYCTDNKQYRIGKIKDLKSDLLHLKKNLDKATMEYNEVLAELKELESHDVQ